MADSTSSMLDACNGLLRYIQNNLDASLSLDYLAVTAGVSKFHLQREFQRITGLSPTRWIQRQRLKRASMRLVFSRHRSITDISFEAGYANAESFTRAFTRIQGQTPSEFRSTPDWARWRSLFTLPSSLGHTPVHVEIVNFQETRIAVVEHLGSTANAYDSARRLIEWRMQHKVAPTSARTFGIHYDQRTHAESGYRIDICVSYEREVKPNPQDVMAKIIPGGRCAVVRYQGSREYIPVVTPLVTEWFPHSGEQLRNFPMFFHYVNVGPNVADHEMMTDVYLPLR